MTAYSVKVGKRRSITDMSRKIMIHIIQKGIKDFCILNALYVEKKKDFVRRVVLLSINVNADIKHALKI